MFYLVRIDSNMERQLHSTPVKEQTPRFREPSFGLSQPSDLAPVGSSTTSSALHHHQQFCLGGEPSVIEKQQKELELLIQELKDRDIELNGLVQIQQRQVAAWTEDRQKILQLEERCLQLQGDNESRDHEIALLKSDLAESQSTEQERNGQIKALELKVYQCTAENKARVGHCKNLEAKLRRRERSESSLQAIIVEKDAELQSYAQRLEEGKAEAKSKLKELQEAVNQLQNQLREYQEEEQGCERELKMKEGELMKAWQENERLRSELASASQAVTQLKTQLRLSGDSERRKDQLLQLQKSKMERCLTELETLKTISTCQQHEISTLKLGRDPIKTTDLTKSVGRKSHDPQHTTGNPRHKPWTSFEYQPKRHSRDMKQRNRSMPPFIDTASGVCPDTSLTSVADELSELLSDREIERHLSSRLEPSPVDQHKPTSRQDPSTTNASQSPPPLPQELTPMAATGDVSLTVDVDHLALQVRDKLSSIFDYMPPTKMKPLHPASVLNRKPDITGKTHSS